VWLSSYHKRAASMAVCSASKAVCLSHRVLEPCAIAGPFPKSSSVIIHLKHRRSLIFRPVLAVVVVGYNCFVLLASLCFFVAYGQPCYSLSIYFIILFYSRNKTKASSRRDMCLKQRIQRKIVITLSSALCRCAVRKASGAREPPYKETERKEKRAQVETGQNH
jgi:hypothetical protein